MTEHLLALTIAGTPVDAPPGVVPDADLGGIIKWVIIILTSIGILASLVYLILGAIKWITSGGDKEKLGKARSNIVYSIIGLIVILLSVVILNFIGSLLYGTPQSHLSGGSPNHHF